MRRTVTSRISSVSSVSSATKQQRPARSRNVGERLRLLRWLVSIQDVIAHTNAKHVPAINQRA